MKHFIKQVFSLQFLVSKPLIVLLITAGCGLWTEINAQYRQDRSFTGSSVSILTSDDTTSASFKALEYDGSLLTITATANRQCAPSPVRVASTLRYIKWVSSSSEGAKRIIKTVLITF